VSVLGSFAEALDAAMKMLPAAFHVRDRRARSIKQVLEEAGSFDSAAIVTGPEGGFEKYEADLARLSGLRLCSMGPRILRCETALSAP
jgi:16S rRNA (uracil1498-N3)-methyltransferase